MQKGIKRTIPLNVTALLTAVFFVLLIFIPHNTYAQKGLDLSQENNHSLFKEALMPKKQMIQSTEKDSNVTLLGRWG